MSLQPSTRLWFLVPLCALLFLLAVNHASLRRNDTLSRLGDGASAEEAGAAPTRAAGTHDFLARNQDVQSYPWLLQTEAQLQSGTWRVRHVAYDNAPIGRELRTPSPYRWWLALVAGTMGLLEGRPAADLLETAARHADPILHALFLLVTAVLVRRWFGVTAGAVHAVAVATLVPFTLPFLAAAPGDHGLTLVVAWFACVPLLAHLRQRQQGPDPETGLHAPLASLAFWAGAAGGITFWVHAATGLALLGACLVGGLVGALIRRDERARDADWLTWGLGGAVSILLCFLAEYAPDHLATWQLEYNHPLWGVAWLGVAGLLHQVNRRGPVVWRWVLGLLTAGMIAAPVVVLFRTPSHAVFTAALGLRAPVLPESLGSDSLVSWLGRTGLTAGAFAALVAVLAILGTAGWRLYRSAVRVRPVKPGTRGGSEPSGSAATSLLVFATAATLALGALAAWQLSWWTLFTVGLLGVMAVTLSHEAIPVASSRAIRRWFTRAILLTALVPSVFFSLARARANRTDTSFGEADIAALVERDIAHWLAQRVGRDKAVVLAPPGLTASLCFHGGLRGLGTPTWENPEGMEGAIRIAGATSPDEGHAIAQKRELTHIVLPSWDPSLETLVQANAPASSTPLISTLHQWQSPRWLRPIAYPMPSIPGFETHSVKIFEVVEVQDNALALSRLAEYFVETQRLPEAVAVALALEQSFPNELSALVSRVLVAKAIRDSQGLNAASTGLVRLVGATLDPMPWDRHVALVISLAELQRFDLAKVQLEHVLATADEPQLRQLSSASLYRLLLLCKLTRMEIADLRLRQLAVQLLPPEMRSRVQ